MGNPGKNARGIFIFLISIMKIKVNWDLGGKCEGLTPAKHYIRLGNRSRSGGPGRRTGHRLGSGCGAEKGYRAGTGRIAEGVEGKEDQGAAWDAEEDQG